MAPHPQYKLAHYCLLSHKANYMNQFTIFISHFSLNQKSKIQFE